MGMPPIEAFTQVRRLRLQVSPGVRAQYVKIHDLRTGDVALVVNGKWQGVVSEPVVSSVPVAKAGGYRNLTATEEAPAKNESGNGNGNGHSRHARVAS